MERGVRRLAELGKRPYNYPENAHFASVFLNKQNKNVKKYLHTLYTVCNPLTKSTGKYDARCSLLRYSIFHRHSSYIPPPVLYPPPLLLPQGRNPKLTMSLQAMNVALVPDKINHPNGMQITYVSDGERVIEGGGVVDGGGGGVVVPGRRRGDGGGGAVY